MNAIHVPRTRRTSVTSRQQPWRTNDALAASRRLRLRSRLPPVDAWCAEDDELPPPLPPRLTLL
ncbi:hypothetical protein ABK046_51615, partial [Streptomyces caeruleatus]